MAVTALVLAAPLIALAVVGALEWVRVRWWVPRWVARDVTGAPAGVSGAGLGAAAGVALAAAVVVPVPLAAWFGVMAWAAVIVWHTDARGNNTIPLEVCWAALAAGVAAVLASYGLSVMWGEGAVAVVTVTLLAGLSLWRGGIGFGDIRLLYATTPIAFAPVLGLGAWIAAFFVGCVLQLIYHVSAAAVSGHSMREARPFGPALAVTFIAAPLALAATAALGGAV